MARRAGVLRANSPDGATWSVSALCTEENVGFGYPRACIDKVICQNTFELHMTVTLTLFSWRTSYSKWVCMQGLWVCSACGSAYPVSFVRPPQLAILIKTAACSFHHTHVGAPYIVCHASTHTHTAYIPLDTLSWILCHFSWSIDVAGIT
jgi:hypothetical protein